MMHGNTKWAEFVSQLRARDIVTHFAWEARRDGQKPSWPKKPADVGMAMFTGLGFQPEILCAIVIDYNVTMQGRERNQMGFGLFIDDSPKMTDDIERIAGKNAPPPSSCGKPVPNMGQSICTRPRGHTEPCRCSAEDVDARSAA